MSRPTPQMIRDKAYFERFGIQCNFSKYGNLQANLGGWSFKCIWTDIYEAKHFTNQPLNAQLNFQKEYWDGIQIHFVPNGKPCDANARWFYWIGTDEGMQEFTDAIRGYPSVWSKLNGKTTALPIVTSPHALVHSMINLKKP